MRVYDLRDGVGAAQLNRLRATVARCWANVPHYRLAMVSKGVHPSDIQTIEDIRKLPFTTKHDLVGNGLGMCAVDPYEIAQYHSTSGTTGTPILVPHTKNDLDIWAELMARSISFGSGGRRGMTMHNAFGYGLFSGGLGFHQGASRLGVTIVPGGAGNTARHVQLIKDLGPSVLVCTPSYALTILDAARSQFVKLDIPFGIFGAEPWSEGMRQELQQGFNMVATDIYGLSEVMGPGVAQECVDNQDGLHIWEDHFYPEIIDPDTGEILEDGDHGELVLTTLTREAMPLIRYRTGDLTRLLPGTSQPNMRRMERIIGRADDMMIIRGVNIFPQAIESVILGVKGLSPHYQIDISKAGRLDWLTVFVETREYYASYPLQLEQELVDRLKSVCGLTVDVRLKPPGQLVRSEGKAKRVIDTREKYRAQTT
jgi:phenylacetate-CoA ligase